MPDVTPKPLRSKGNAIINLMGVVGAVIILASGILFGTGNPQNSLMSYVVYFAMVAVLMIVALVVFLFTVNEPKLVKKMKEESEEMGIVEEADDAEHSDKKNEGKLSRGEFRSLIFILLSVIFWFMGYNAITSKYSVYAGAVLQLDYNTTLILAQAAALVAFIPVGMLATKIGRKKSILIGVGFLTSAVFVGSFFDAGVNIWLVNIVFIFAGLGWAMINVNSYPMVVELASRGNVGKYTGFYYTASMSAQTLTPILSGFFLDEYGIKTLFPYAAICVGISFVTMLFVKHGDSKPLAKKPSLDALDID
jgi:MFS family permease